MTTPVIKDQEYLELVKHYHEMHFLNMDGYIIDKKIISENISSVINNCEEGETDPLKVYAYISSLERIIKGIKDGIREYSLDEFRKYGEKSVTLFDGVEMSQVESGVKLDYSNTEKWVELNTAVLHALAERKDLENILKAVKKPGVISYDDELIDVNPPIRQSTTTLKASIK